MVQVVQVVPAGAGSAGSAGGADGTGGAGGVGGAGGAGGAGRADDTAGGVIDLLFIIFMFLFEGTLFLVLTIRSIFFFLRRLMQ